MESIFSECIQGLSRAEALSCVQYLDETYGYFEALSCVQYLDETYGYFTTVIIDLVPVYEVCWMIGG